ncbi:IpaD/SipD/SspD family type III secretion system needle tip protein [Pectobacterium versatile]|uniref:IpaD/SipD/SspD family type III secretion system needle tip protein n=1 Tax=Pectobacterium versatile TaxID=2488639 RepID=UPI001CD07AD5|nr:IpaD/SipD/SspD family type III secretion system needle tip protein [Pectobacterium versatile]
MTSAISSGEVRGAIYIHHNVSENNVDPHVGSVINGALLKALLCQLTTSENKPSPSPSPMLEAKGKLDKIEKLLMEHDLDIGKSGFEHSKMGSALRRMDVAFSHAQRFGDNSKDFKNQTRCLEKECARAVEDIHYEMSNNRLVAKYTGSQLSVALLNMAKTAEDDIGDSNENGKRSGEFTTGTSYAELWSAIANAIQTIKEDYVDFYAELMKQYTDMYEAYNNHVQKASSEAISAGKDGNTVLFDLDKTNAGYKDFDDYIKAHSPTGSVKNWDQMDEKEKDYMKTTLAPAYHVNDKGDITFNLDSYNNTVKDSSPSAKDKPDHGTFEASTSSYQAWLATFNSAGSALQSNMQSFAQRYSQANSAFDNLNKVLSGAISSLGESAKDVLKSLS